jgi:formyl-CoA transferase
VQSIDKALTSQHAAHRGDVVEKDWYKGVASPIRMGRSQASLRSVPPTFGQHTAEVLAEFGYSKSEIEGLMAEGVIATERRR